MYHCQLRASFPSVAVFLDAHSVRMGNLNSINFTIIQIYPILAHHPLRTTPMSVTTTSILHRTPWIPPVAVRGEGIYVDLQDGRRVIDGIGGAAVSCIGTSHPKVIAAIKEQLDTLTCPSQLIFPT